MFGRELVLAIASWELVLFIFKYELVPVWAKHVAGARRIVCRAIACPLVSLEVRTDGRTDGRTDRRTGRRTCNDIVLSRHDLENLIL